MIKNIVIFAGLILLFPGLVFCQTDIQINRKLETSVFAYKNKEDHKKWYGQAKLLVPIEVTWSDHPSFRLVADPQLQVDSEGIASGVRSVVDERERKIVDAREVFMEYIKNKWEFSLGWQIKDWSITDTVSPSDNLNPLDLAIIPEWERKPAPMASLRYGYDNFVEIAVKPFFTSPILPEFRWRSPRTPGVNILSPKEEEDRFDFGVRVGGLAYRTDWQVTFYSGYADNPYGEIMGSSAPGIKVKPRYSREQVASLGIVRNLPLLNVLGRGEIGYFHQDKGDNFIQYVVGAEKYWQNLIGAGDELFALLQFSAEDVTDKDSDIIRLSDFRRIFDDAFIGKVHYQFGQNSPWKLKLRGSWNIEDEDSFVEPAVEYKRRKWKLEVGTWLVTGPDDSFWGQYDRNDSIFSRLTVKF